MDRGDDRVFNHLGHRLAPETVSDFGSRLSKDRHLARSLFESSQLELRILSRQIVAVRFQRIGIARPEVFEYGGGAVPDRRQLQIAMADLDQPRAPDTPRR
jgi:hypothetical protein